MENSFILIFYVISYTIIVISQFLQNPHIVVIHILRYIKKARWQRLLYKDKDNTQVIRYCDANWVDSSIDSRSTTWYFVFTREDEYQKNKML